MTARTAVAILYVAGFALVAGSVLWGWWKARARFSMLSTLEERVRSNCARYYELSEQIQLIEPTPEEQARNPVLQAEQQELQAAQDRELRASGIARRGSPIQDGWVPAELATELLLLRVALGSVKGAGLCALVGAALSTVASVWSLYL